MAQEQNRAETVSLLQELGLKEYEARCFLALAQLSTGTAKQISDISEVPRTRVYDAVRVLEAHGLVEVQHSNPQQFRAVSVEEAMTTLRQKYDDRIETLGSYLDSIDYEDDEDDEDWMQQVWSMNGSEAITSRTIDVLGDAESEIVFVVIDEGVLTDRVFDRLNDAADAGVQVIIGAMDDGVVSRIESEVPAARVFETGLDWLVGEGAGTEVAISRLLLADRTTLLVSSFYPGDGDGNGPMEQAVFANGLGNGVVVLIRRLLATGLLPWEDPGK